MPTAKDGSVHNSFSRANFHDQVQADKQKPIGSGDTKTAASFPPDTKTPIEEHVGLHGPAHKVEYEHHEAKNVHHVTSHHGEGEEGKHHSTHKSHEAAHEHMGQAMGMGEGEEKPEDEETPDENEMGSQQPSGANSIPGVE
jgi:hypothetical protein